MVIFALLLASLSCLTFAFLYLMFFPWWRSGIGRSLVVSKTCMGVLIGLLAVSWIVDLSVSAEAWVSLAAIVALFGLGFANIGMIGELYRTWKNNDSR